MSNELKPCPFCGPVKGNAQVFPGPGNEGFFVHCITCGVSTDTFVGQEDAECAWHMRYDAPPAQGIDLDSMYSVARKAWDKHQAECCFTTVGGSLMKVCKALIDDQRDAAPGVGNG